MVGTLGVVTALTAASDWYTSVEVTGPIIPARVLERDDEKPYYVAVDDGVSPPSGRFASARSSSPDCVKGGS